jgi:hypothetical protein
VLPNSFSAVPRASDTIFMFCVPELLFGGIEGVRSVFHVKRPDSFSAVLRGSGPVFIFCAPGLIFGGTEGAVSRFNVMRA